MFSRGHEAAERTDWSARSQKPEFFMCVLNSRPVENRFYEVAGALRDLRVVLERHVRRLIAGPTASISVMSVSTFASAL